MYQVFTHNDLDGVSCGIIAKLAFGDEVQVRYNSVEGLNFQVERFLKQVEEKGMKDSYLFITDLSVHETNEKGLAAYVESGGKVKLIDHHKTALHFNQYPWGMVHVQYEDGRLASATSLFYEYLIQHRLMQSTPAIDEYVELVRQYDTWEWDHNDNVQAKRLNDLFFMLSLDEFEEKMVERLRTSEHFAFDAFEEKILDMEDEKIERYVRRKKRETVQTFIHQQCVGIVHAESYHSELGNELGKEYSHLDYIAILNMSGKKMSLRTIHDDIDVSKVAGQFGGGGHAKASGCTLNEEVYRLYVAEPFPLEPIRQDAFKNQYNIKGSRAGSLYENRQGDQFMVFQENDSWYFELNNDSRSDAYASFNEVERDIKREHQAWLVRDDVFVRWLMEHMKNTKFKG